MSKKRCYELISVLLRPLGGSCVFEINFFYRERLILLDGHLCSNGRTSPLSIIGCYSASSPQGMVNTSYKCYPEKEKKHCCYYYLSYCWMQVWLPGLFAIWTFLL